MSVQVGVMRITYVDGPPNDARRFLWHLAEEGGCDDAWGGAWDGNAVMELTLRRTLRRARAFASHEGLPPDETEALVQWVKRLPWDGDTIMLHINW